jgi:cytochrome c-type biogenesis protein CcsB
MAGVMKEQRQTAGGITLIVIVVLAIAFLLYMATLNHMMTGNLWSETYLLFATLIFYAGAGALYMGFAATGTESYVKFASLATWLGFIANSAAAAHRWMDAGHPPFTNIYEMLLSSVWALAALTLITEKRFGIKVIGAVTMPLAVVGLVLMQLLRTEVHPLVPLLQSNWLSVHVTLAILAYAACALSFALAIMFLIQDKMKTETFLAITGAVTLAIYTGVVLTYFEDWVWLMTPALLVVATPLVFYGLAHWKNSIRFMAIANRAMVVSTVAQALTLAALLLNARAGRSVSLGAGGSLPTALAANPFILTGLVGSILISLLYLLLAWRRPDLERLLPTSDNLDRITYKTICLAFPLLTLTIATGAYWANQTWGTYWDWDPKETWAAITWLVYALYLHMRITVGWRGRRAAYFAIAGFAVVIFTFFGVPYLLRGVHAFV